MEDDESPASLPQKYLQRHEFIVSLLHKGSRTLETVLETNPDLVILDLMLPDASDLVPENSSKDQAEQAEPVPPDSIVVPVL
ncbi:MAG: response regulator [Candidatus Aegiribacteria sp.]|nr:response regulator [Candidatus Aegiribacteria sp.]